MGTSPVLSSRSALSFAFAFVVANFVGITLFDGARGPRWWTAPLTASFTASLVFSHAYYPAAFAGIYDRWADAALAHLAVFFGVSVLLLVPYWLLRPAMRPLDGRKRVSDPDQARIRARHVLAHCSSSNREINWVVMAPPKLFGIDDGDGALVIARHVMTDADGGELDRRSGFDIVDHPAQMPLQIIAGIDRQGRIVHRRAIGDHHQDLALFGPRHQAVMRPHQGFAVDILLQQAFAHHQAEIFLARRQGSSADL